MPAAQRNNNNNNNSASYHQSGTRAALPMMTSQMRKSGSGRTSHRRHSSKNAPQKCFLSHFSALETWDESLQVNRYTVHGVQQLKGLIIPRLRYTSMDLYGGAAVQHRPLDDAARSSCMQGRSFRLCFPLLKRRFPLVADTLIQLGLV